MIEAILRRISDDYDREEQFNVDDPFDRTVAYRREREQRGFMEAHELLMSRGQVEEADLMLWTGYRPSSFVTAWS